MSISVVGCDLCHQYTPIKDNALFGVRGGVLVELGREWERKSGTRHVCKLCVGVIGSGSGALRPDGTLMPYAEELQLYKEMVEIMSDHIRAMNALDSIGTQTARERLRNLMIKMGLQAAEVKS